MSQVKNFADKRAKDRLLSSEKAISDIKNTKYLPNVNIRVNLRTKIIVRQIARIYEFTKIRKLVSYPSDKSFCASLKRNSMQSIALLTKLYRAKYKKSRIFAVGKFE
jgi:hypothetical protein